jgi:hypothetical protein
MESYASLARIAIVRFAAWARRRGAIRLHAAAIGVMVISAFGLSAPARAEVTAAGVFGQDEGVAIEDGATTGVHPDAGPVEGTDLGFTGDADRAAWPAAVRRVEAAFPAPRAIVPGHGAIDRTAAAYRHILDLLGPPASGGGGGGGARGAARQ